jgi:hypothetical protein
MWHSPHWLRGAGVQATAAVGDVGEVLEALQVR